MVMRIRSRTRHPLHCCAVLALHVHTKIGRLEEKGMRESFFVLGAQRAVARSTDLI